MAYIIDIPTFSDSRGKLSVIEQLLPFEIKRVYYIYDTVGQRGGHRHKKATQGLICLGGNCSIYVNDSIKEQTFLLNSPSQCLILDPKDWHTMDHFTTNATLLVFSSEYYDLNDYIDEAYL